MIAGAQRRPNRSLHLTRPRDVIFAAHWLASIAQSLRGRAGELSRSAAITEGYRKAFAKACEQVKDAGGAMVEVKFEHRAADPPFKLPEGGWVMKHARRAVEAPGLEPIPLFSNGLGANWFDKHGVPTVTIGAGQSEIHTVNEHADLPEFAIGCRLAVALATLEV